MFDDRINIFTDRHELFGNLPQPKVVEIDRERFFVSLEDVRDWMIERWQETEDVIVKAWRSGKYLMAMASYSLEMTDNDPQFGLKGSSPVDLSELREEDLQVRKDARESGIDFTIDQLSDIGFSSGTFHYWARLRLFPKTELIDIFGPRE